MNLQSQKFKYLVLFITGIITIFVIGRNIITPDIMFRGHDETQAARVEQFTFNLQNHVIPPRIAPSFSFGLGYPIFNYYAPFSYWVTSSMNFVGIDVLTSLKISYILALTIGFFGMFLLLKRFFSFYPSLLGAVTYIASPYIAVEIFVRGNLAEMWFFALFPLSLYLLLTNSVKRLPLTAIILWFLFTSHNIFSLFALAFIAIFIAFSKNKKINSISFLSGLVLSSYFYIPLFLELSQVHAANVAKLTDFHDHFLCPSQLWTSLWGFAGSAKGCNADGMSFMLGKLHILFGAFGLLVFLFDIVTKKITKKTFSFSILFGLLLILSVLFTFEITLPIWELLKPVAALLQFPWRLLLLSGFGLSYFAAYGTDKLKYQITIILLIIIGGFVIFNGKFFYGQTLSYDEFNNQYLSKEYINNKVAFRVPEYLPISSDYALWRMFENKPIETNPFIVNTKNTDIIVKENNPFSKTFEVKSTSLITLQIHYAPYWIIRKNNSQIIPNTFDLLGRPQLQVSNNKYDTIHVEYKQTAIEQIADSITLLGLIGLTLYIFNPSWQTHIQTKKQ